MSNSTILPYLFFAGRCQEALEFYRSAIGARIEMMIKYSESPEPAPPGMLPPGYENKIMHSSFKVGDNTLMGSDGCGEKPGFKGFKLSLSYSTQEEAERVFAALSEGGAIDMPLAKTFWSPMFGMLRDRFGLPWMISVESK